MKKICIVTGTRAEWGLLSRIAGLIKTDNDLQLQIIATNMHLNERFGMTYKEIEADGFKIDYKVPMEAHGDTAKDTVKSMGMAMSGFADAYSSLQPDLLMVLGDRYEILVAVSAALIFKIPVAHLHGGEITEGAFDDAIRHAITKMSHLHFTSTEQYRQRVIQMGEQPEYVFNVGAMGVDNIKQIPLWSKGQTVESLGGFMLDKNTILVTYHPVTIEDNTAEKQIDELLTAIDTLSYIRVIFTMPNSDIDSKIIEEKIKYWCTINIDRAIWFTSLGLKRYLSILQYIGAVVGNSSSGIIEVPSFGIPTLNIGNRQKGRLKADSVIDCAPNAEDIRNNLLEILHKDCKFADNPYERANSAKNITRVLKEMIALNMLQKHFYNLKFGVNG